MSDINKLESRLDEMAKSLASIDKTLIRQELSLAEHIRRTGLAEQRLELLQEDMNNRLKPIQTHVQLVNNIVKFVLFLAGLVTFLNQLGFFSTFNIN